MLDELTAEQLAEWEAFDKIDPIGDWRGDYHAALLSSVLTNLVIQVHGKSGAKLTELMDFMPNWDGEKTERGQSPSEMKSILMALVKKQNEDVQRKSKSPPQNNKKLNK